MYILKELVGKNCLTIIVAIVVYGIRCPFLNTDPVYSSTMSSLRDLMMRPDFVRCA